jgi:hypothetical protein
MSGGSQRFLHEPESGQEAMVSQYIEVELPEETARVSMEGRMARQAVSRHRTVDGHDGPRK